MKITLLIPALLLTGLLSSCVIHTPPVSSPDPRPGPLADLLHGILAMQVETGEWPRSISQLVEAGAIDREAWWLGLAEISEVDFDTQARQALYQIFIHEHEHNGVIWREGVYALRVSDHDPIP